jgi:ATP-dependent helicase/nuclease subunit A
MISRALMLRLFLLAKGDEKADKVSLLSDKLVESSGIYFPEGYEVFIERIREMPLFEATESIIKFFGLGEYSWNVAYLNTFQDYVVSFTGNKNADIQSFLEWWESTGIKKSVILPGNQDAMRILTIHKSKGLEFKVVLLPFLDWNLDHISSNQPVLWVKPSSPPFNDLGIVPVRYTKELLETVFAKEYKEEKYSVYIDNINLLYVAFTRAKDAIYGFSVDNPRSKSSVARVLKDAVTLNAEFPENSNLNLNLNLSSCYNIEKRILEIGEIPENKSVTTDSSNLTSLKYSVSGEVESLKLKLHGENYFSSEKIDVRQKINYGKLMHEVFEGIATLADIAPAVRKLVLEGKLTEEESIDIEKRINSLINIPQVSEWFLPGNKAITEAGILLPAGTTRRPDRVIFKDGKTIIIDFKFGEENPHYVEQVREYSRLLKDMGYKDTDAFIWFVDKNIIISADVSGK